MKRGIGIGTLVVIGLIAWWLSRNKQAQAAESLPELAYRTEYGESEYEKLHKVVPITRYVEREIPVYQTIEEWEEAHG